MQFGKEVPHYRPRVWVRLPLNFTIETENFYINMLNCLIARLHYTERKKSIWSSSSCKNHHLIWVVSRFPARSTIDPPLPQPVCKNTSDFQTPRYGWIRLVRPWLTNPQEHTRSWRTNPLVYFLKPPLQSSAQLRFFQYTAERYLWHLDPLQQECLIFVVVVEWS